MRTSPSCILSGLVVLGLIAAACSSSNKNNASSDGGLDGGNVSHGGSANNGGSSNGGNGHADASTAGSSSNSDAATADAASGDAALNSGSDAATGDSGDASVGNVLVDGNGYGIVYSSDGNIGIDSRPTVSATFDSDGNMTGYNWSATEQLSIGSATLRSASTNGAVAWGTWIGGPTTGVFYANLTGAFTFDPMNGGFHFAIGKFATTVPTGTVSYALVGNSSPTLDSGTQPGTVDSANIAIDYDTGKVGLEIVVTTEAGTTSYQTTGGVTDVSNAEGSIHTDQVRFFVNDIPNLFDGIIVNDGDALAVTYMLEAAAATDGGTPAQVRGALAFERQ